MNVGLRGTDYIFFCHIEEHVFHYFGIFADPESMSFEAHPRKPRRQIFH